jgi:hypothetical protein
LKSQSLVKVSLIIGWAELLLPACTALLVLRAERSTRQSSVLVYED